MRSPVIAFAFALLAAVAPAAVAAAPGLPATAADFPTHPELAGSLVALPASASAMHDPDLLVRTGETVPRVTGR